jgi:membrane protease YdiL (CAAX protease family)
MNKARALHDRSLENKLLRFATRSLTQKIQASNTRIVSALETRVKNLEERRRQSIFMTQIFIGLALYLFGLNAVQPLNQILPANTIISGTVIIGFLFATLYSIRKSKAPPELYGLHLKTWKRDLNQSLLWSSPLLIMAVAFKYIWAEQDTTGLVKFIQPEAIFSDPSQFSWTAWGAAASAYIVLSIAQEVIGRSGIQTTLSFLFSEDNPSAETKKRTETKAIWVSSLLFSATHTHLGATFSALVFIPGLFWAWMYSRQGSIVGTCLSHCLLGLVLVFILGLPV